MADEGLCFMQPRCSEIQAVASDVLVTRLRLVFDRLVLSVFTLITGFSSIQHMTLRKRHRSIVRRIASTLANGTHGSDN